jgi:universal stress protein E
LATPVYVDPVLASAQGLVALEQELRQNVLRRLEAIGDRLRVHGIKVTVSAEWDHPAHEAILRRAQVIKADLIVASLHSGRHRLPWVLRLTDWELVRHSPIPLLPVKNPHPYRHPTVLAAIDPAHAHEKPLQLDKEILRIGRTLTTVLRGTLHAVHAYSSFLVGHLPVDAITEAARKTHSAIVVMGALSRSGYKRLLIGNTAERILDELPCDLLVVKPANFRSRVPRVSRGVRLRVNGPAGALGYSFSYC